MSKTNELYRDYEYEKALDPYKEIKTIGQASKGFWISSTIKTVGVGISAKVLLILLGCLGIIIIVLIVVMTAIMYIPNIDDYQVSYRTNQNSYNITIQDQGPKIKDNVLTLVHETKPKKYFDYEDSTYPKNFTAKQAVYTESVDVSDGIKSSKFLSYDPNNDAYDTNDILLPLESYAEPYRTYRELFGSIDAIAQQVNKPSTKVLSSIYEHLRTDFVFTFDCTEIQTEGVEYIIKNAENFKYYESLYINHFKQVDLYIDGIYDKTHFEQVNTLERTPLPYFEKATTAYFNFEFNFYERIVESDWMYLETDIRRETKEVPDENGTHVRIPGTGNIMPIESYIMYMQSIGRSDEIDTTNLQKYRLVEYQYITTSYEKSRLEAWTLQKLFDKNTRLDNWIETLNFDPPFRTNDKDYMLIIGASFADSFEFTSWTGAYLEKKIKLIGSKISSSYDGTESGNYKFMSNNDILYGSMIAFLEGSEQKVRISSGFGDRTYLHKGQEVSGFHKGIDLAIPEGTPIISIADGTCIYSGYEGNYGYVIKIHHDDGLYSIYAHNQSLFVQEGDTVKKGELIAASGNTGRSTGPHLHFEIRDMNYIAQDPMKYLNIIKID